MRYVTGSSMAVLVLLVLAPQLRAQYVPSAPPLRDGGGGKAETQADDEVGQPYYVFDDKIHHFSPGGYMPGGDIRVSQSQVCETEPHRGKYCYRVVCDLRQDAWMGIAFLPGGKWTPVLKIDVFEKLGGAKKGDPIVLRFWARSPNGATVQFKVGGIDEDSVQFPVASQWVHLTKDWRKYTLDLTGQDLSGLRAGFMWVINIDNNPRLERPEFCTDDIYFTKVKARPRDTVNEGTLRDE
jgi:hypothetical protein